MANKIRIAICGYGNLGRGVEKAIAKNKDMELKVIFTRREPEKIAKQTKTPVVSIEERNEWVDLIDVVIMCGGSATDLPKQVPMFAGMFNTVDSFDTHADIPSYFAKVEQEAQKGGTVSIISTGWDPGMFSINRLYAEAILPEGKTYTFWGEGVSQGHSDAIRRIEGVKNAIQYTIPKQEALECVRNGETPEFTTRQKHLRECYVVLEAGVDKSKIEAEIKNMPKYFADYDTNVHFISEEELIKEHSGMPHGGSVIHIAETSEENKQVVEYSLKLASNPEFTGSILVAYARAAYRMKKEGASGAKTVFDVAPNMLSMKTTQELLKMV